tara:strand:- start:150 stop:428 length:279 start_codon:yes stop_codon:yes gene_type:complete
MSHPPDYQDKRYDNKARRLFTAAAATAQTEEDGRVSLDLEAWEALGKGLDRSLMVGDVARFAEEKPAAVFNRAKRLLGNAEWMARAQAGEGA